MLKEMNGVCEDDQIEEGIGQFGRIEIMKNADEVEIHKYFCDMRTYEPDVSVELPEPDYSEIDDLINSALFGNKRKMVEASLSYTTNLAPVKTRSKQTLTRRMADIEYPFLRVLKRMGVLFHILNPNKGTIKRAQQVFDTKRITIVLTRDNPRFFDYLEEVESMNELDWPIIDVDELDESILYYAGFTAKKYIDFNIVGYEVNPRNLVSSYDGKYEIESDTKRKLDHIIVQRGPQYEYEEEYPWIPDYNRYEADMVREELKDEAGYVHHSYPLMYNIITTQLRLPWLRPNVPIDLPPTVIGMNIEEAVCKSPYDAFTSIVQKYNYVEIEGSIAPVSTGKEEIVGYLRYEEKDPRVEVDVVLHHRKMLERRELVEPREEYVGDLPINERGNKVYEGPDHIECWKRYNVDITDRNFIDYIHSKYVYTQYGFEERINKEQETVYKIRKPRGAKNTIYYHDGNYYDGEANLLPEPIIRKEDGFYKGQQFMPLKIYEMIEVPDGPWQFGDRYFCPLAMGHYTLQHWREYFRKIKYLHYYTNHEYILRVANEQWDEEITPYSGYVEENANGNDIGYLYRVFGIGEKPATQDVENWKDFGIHDKH